MDDSQQDIFNSLSQHEEQPPEDLFKKIIGKIRNEPDKQQGNEFESLREFTITPPAELYAQIRENTRLKNKTLLSYLYKYRVAAAILIAVITFGAIYQLRSKNETGDEIVTKKAIPTTAVPDTITAKPGNIARVETTNNSKNKTLITPGPKEETVELSFIDNDLLSSLTECTGCNFAAYYSGKKKMVLTLDPYSSVTVTTKMSSFMKTLYSTNRRNKPTHKARKAKKTLLKWKKTDTDYFDSASFKTALDPLDLTEYIIDNK